MKSAVPAGTRVGSYILGDRLAVGGFGVVYHATHLQQGTPAAIKLLHDFLVTRPDVIHRFEREIEVIRRIRHPNVVQILEHGRDDDDVPFLVLELLEGITLDEHLALSGPLSAEETLELLEPLAAALAAAHALGVIHRDVKASNVFLASEGGCGARRRVVLLDFGIAKLLDAGEPSLTTSRQLVGSPACMSPEQIQSQPVDARTDVYGLGVLAFRMLSGELPFKSQFFSVLRELHLHVQPPSLGARISIRPALDEAILKALRKEPADRHGTVETFVQAVRSAMEAPATPDALARIERRVLAVHAEVHPLDAAENDPPADVETVLQSVIDDLAAAGLSVIVATGGSVLLSLDLPADPRQEQRVRGGALEALLALSDALADPVGRALGTCVRLSCHVGAIITAPDGDPVAGDVLDVAAWVPDVVEEGVFASPEALRGLDITPSAGAGTGGAGRRLRASAP